MREVARILDSGQSSKFEFEGAVRAGLRVQRVLAGETWREADKFSGLIVELALCRIGAVRPSWQVAQPVLEHRLPRWTCKTCGGRLDGERWLYCSPECKAVAVQRSTEARMKAVGDAARAAFWAARSRGEQPTRECARCGKGFQVRVDGPRRALQKFCSRECYEATHMVDRSRTCPVCEREFSYLKKSQRFCSPTCSNRAMPATSPERACAVCSAIFTDRSRAGAKKFCGDACGKRYRRAQPDFRCEAA